MVNKVWTAAFSLAGLSVGLLFFAVGAWLSRPVEPVVYSKHVDGYVALAPSVLRAGGTENISVSLLDGDQPATGVVQVRLLRDGAPVAVASERVDAQAHISLRIPQESRGAYELELSGPGFFDKAPVKVQDGGVLFVETDKPIYRPGQTVHIRLLALDGDLKPLAGRSATVEVQDAKGIKVFKQVVASDDFGMAKTDLPLSTEPNLGVWKLTTTSGAQKNEVDVRVEEYVLPKYEVKVDLPKDWVLANEVIKGTVSAEYSFGKPVKGTVVIKATRYVGTWQEYAKITKDIDSSTDFQVSAPGYVAGVPGSGGLGNVQLQVTVQEQATGYEEKTTHLVTVAPTAVTLQLIPESLTFKTGLPLSILVVAQTPDKKPVDASVTVNLVYTNKDFSQGKQEKLTVATKDGRGVLKVSPPVEAIALTAQATASEATASLALNAAYSPTGNFIHLEQSSAGPLKVGDKAQFHIDSTREARIFYYEVLSRGRVVFSGASTTPDITLTLTPVMAPSSRLLVYQIIAGSEVAADYLPFSVEGDYPLPLDVTFSKNEVTPGSAVNINIQTQGQAKVGLVAVDKSVFILAENRLNLQQVFAELEKLYGQPQAEMHDVRMSQTIATTGAKETFTGAGVVVMSNVKVPEGAKYDNPFKRQRGGVIGDGWNFLAAPAGAPEAAFGAADKVASTASSGPSGLAEVQRVRQFFPETWLWMDGTTNAQGRLSVPVTAPDTITTWMLQAIGVSKDRGLGVGQAQLKVFQPFFLSVDLPYSAIRGEQFPVKIALYNYLGTSQQIVVDLDKSDAFELLSALQATVTVPAGDVGSATFTIKPRKLGPVQLKVTARSSAAADAVIKPLFVEPEGISREVVDNKVLSAGGTYSVDTTLPSNVIEGSGRAYVALTGSYMTQTIEGLEGLLKMPFGCGEQNMILFAPNVFVAKYLKESGQSKPEVLAKAQSLMLTGYQREMVYRHNDGAFSAFGNQDKEGSLWLTSFVLKTFAQAQEFVYIDPSVLNDASSWIVKTQQPDGSFKPVGLVLHQEMLGGLTGNDALTAYVAVALMESGEKTSSAKAVRFLEGRIASVTDPYTLALVTYTLELAKSPNAGAAYDKLMGMAKSDEDGLHWGDDIRPLDTSKADGPIGMRVRPQPHEQSASIETTGYAPMALLAHGDRINAGRAARWLVSRRGAYGGFGSTQDTVVGLQALTAFSTASLTDVDMTVTLAAPSFRKEVRITPQNADVLQMVEVPTGVQGQVVLQAVRRYNIPETETPRLQQPFQITVSYGADHVSVDDLITVSTTVKFAPADVKLEAGMVVLDVAVPTGFAPDAASLKALMDKLPSLKRYDVAGRKVILYIENMKSGDSLSFQFQARALYPVRAQAVTSQAYAYYNPSLKGETLGGALVVE